VVGVVVEVGVEETGVDSVEVAEAGIQVSVAVEVGVEVEATSVAAAEAAVEISEGVVETLEVEEAVTGASTVVEVEGVAGAVVLGNREGARSFFFIFPPNHTRNTEYLPKTSRRLWMPGLQTSLKMSS